MQRLLFLSAFICVYLRFLNPVLAALPEPKFRHQTIDDKIQIGYGVAAADVDGDKKIDILLADKRQFVWYRNPTWEKFVIAENLTERDNVCLAAQDLDGDGKCELAVGGDWDPNDRENSGAVFYMVAPDDRTQKWEPVRLHAEPTVHRMRWMKLDEGGSGLVVAPLHGRGDAPSKILLYRQPEDVRGEWALEVLDESMHATHNIEIDEQGTAITIAGAQGRLGLRRIQQDGEIVYVKAEPMPPAAGEIRHGRGLTATIEPMHGNKVVAYHGASRHVLIETMVEGHALGIGDFIGAQSPQVVAGWRGKGGGLLLFATDNDARWHEFVIDDGGMACEDLAIADLDGDSDLDIVASGRATKNLKIYWNETADARR